MKRREFFQQTAFAGVAMAMERSALAAGEVTLYLDPVKGADANAGTKAAPLKTLAAAAARVNKLQEPGAVTLVLDEGIYAVNETAVFQPARPFKKTERLTIRAAVLPDDPDWNPARMPTLIHTMAFSADWNGRPDPFGGVAYGMQIETSHATVQGLRVFGMPAIEKPKKGAIHRLYAIGRNDRSLDDLEVKQCLFAGDEVTNPHHLPLLINGSGLVVDHCIFHRVKQSVVYWSPGTKGHAMRNCRDLRLQGRSAGRPALRTISTTGIMSWRTANLFGSGKARGRFRLSCSNSQGEPAEAAAGWHPHRTGRGPGRQPEGPTPPDARYTVRGSLFAGNRKFTGSGAGPALNFRDNDPSFLELVETRRTDQPIELEMDESKRDYLHPIAGSEAAKISAGLFMKPVA